MNDDSLGMTTIVAVVTVTVTLFLVFDYAVVMMLLLSSLGLCVVPFLYLMTALEHPRWLLRLIDKHTLWHAVELMDFCNRTHMTLVRECNDGSYQGWMYPLGKNGQLRLFPNGFVDRDCEVGFYYIWRPLDHSLLMELSLSWSDQWPNWQEWQLLTHSDRIAIRDSILYKL